jgi:hypothetical protein
VGQVQTAEQFACGRSLDSSTVPMDGVLVFIHAFHGCHQAIPQCLNTLNLIKWRFIWLCFCSALRYGVSWHVVLARYGYENTLP